MLNPSGIYFTIIYKTILRRTEIPRKNMKSVYIRMKYNKAKYGLSIQLTSSISRKTTVHRPPQYCGHKLIDLSYGKFGLQNVVILLWMSTKWAQHKGKDVGCDNGKSTVQGNTFCTSTATKIGHKSKPGASRGNIEMLGENETTTVLKLV